MPLDPTLSLMLLLKSNWQITNPTGSAITFTTGPYAQPVQYPMIQVIKRQRTPSLNYEAGASQINLTIGTKPIYWIKQRMFIDIYVKPDWDSNTDIGQKKQQRWNMVEECRRILISNPTGSQDTDFVMLGGTVDFDELDPRPTILHSRIGVTAFLFRSGSLQ